MKRDVAEHLCADGRIGKMAWTSNPSHFRVFRFLFGRGTDVHLPSQENEIQSISQQPPSVSEFIICLFRHAESEDISSPPIFIYNYFILSNACSKSAIISSICSVPIESRIVFGFIFCSSSSSGLSCEWVVVAG